MSHFPAEVERNVEYPEWYTHEYVGAIRPSTYDPVKRSCYIQAGQLIVRNIECLGVLFCPPVTICRKAIELEIDTKCRNVQTGYIASYASIPLGKSQQILPEVAGYLAGWGLEVIRRDRWFMNSDEVGFESVVHFLSLYRQLWPR